MELKLFSNRVEIFMRTVIVYEKSELSEAVKLRGAIAGGTIGILAGAELGEQIDKKI